MADDDDNNDLDDDLEPTGIDDDLADALGLGVDSQTQIFLEMRKQNVDLLKLAVKTVGLGNGPGRPNPEELRKAMEQVWNVYSEFYEWIDPEEAESEE